MKKLYTNNLFNNKRNRSLKINKETFSTSISSTNENNNSPNIIIKENINNQLFKKNPNLKFKQIISKSNDFLGFNDLFEIYISIKDNIYYLVSPNYLNYNLDIITLNNNKLIRSLKGHKNHITTIRYFTNNINEYLISADINSVVIIFNISDIIVENLKIKLKYTNWIYSCLLLFNFSNYIFTSCCGKGNTKIYLFENKSIIFLKNIKDSKNNNTYYLLTWYNKKNNKYYLIEFCKKKIVITNIDNNKLYANLTSENSNQSCYMNGYIFNQYKNKNIIDNNYNYKELLFAISNNGYINIWDIYKKELFKSIFINDCIIGNFIQWNEKYIILVDGYINCLKIINLDIGKIINNIFSQYAKGILYIKKIYHPKYGESLISSGQDGIIKLWII